MNDSIFEKISYLIDKVVGYFAILFGILMTVTTLVGILFRYVMTNPLPWTEELARYSMIWMGLLAISMGVRRNEHLGLRLIIDKFPTFFRKIFKYLTYIMIGIFLYMLMVYGYRSAVNGFRQIAPALRIPMFYVLVAVPVSALLSLIQLFLRVAYDIQSWIRGYEKSNLSERSGI